MNGINASNFGLIIAYLIPGFICLWGGSYLSETLSGWLGAVPGEEPTVGGFLYVTLVSVTFGLTASTVRWLVIDTIHRHTGIPYGDWDFSRLENNVSSYNLLVEVFYRYYQFYGNSCVAISALLAARCWARGNVFLDGLDVGLIMLLVVFAVGSRDTFKKYNKRMSALFGK